MKKKEGEKGKKEWKVKRKKGKGRNKKKNSPPSYKNSGLPLRALDLKDTSDDYKKGKKTRKREKKEAWKSLSQFPILRRVAPGILGA